MTTATATATPSASDVERHVRVRIPKAKRQGAEWRAPCPIHKGQRDSFAVSVETGEWYCHSRCGRGGSLFDLEMELTGCDYRTAVERITGREPGNGGGQRIVATYDYTDEQGNLLFQVVRYKPKSFRQRRPDGAGGWLWNLDGARRVLYRLPEVLKAQAVFVTEGEKDADNLARLGLAATTNPGGAGKWRAEYSEHFRGRRAAMIPDADETGQRHALEVAESLLGVAESVRVVEVPAGKDVSEWLERGGTEQALLDLARGAAELNSERLAALRARWFPPARVETREAEPEPEPEPEAFPETAWRGAFADYRLAMGDTTEAPDAAHFAALWSVAGALLGRRVGMFAGGQIYANVYLGFFGPTGDKKTTAMRRILDHGLCDPVRVVRNLGSTEGLADAMGAEGSNGGSVLFFWEELSPLLARARWSGSTILEFVTETFDCPESWGLKYRKDPIQIKQPTPTILAATTPDWFWKNARDDDFHGGALNRFLFFTGPRKALLPNPRKPQTALLARVAEHLARLSQLQPCEARWDETAAKVWDAFYLDWESRERTGLLAAALKRIHAYVRRIFPGRGGGLFPAMA